MDSVPSWHGPSGEYLYAVSKTSVDVDRDIAEQAAAILGTTTLRDTIDASLREIRGLTVLHYDSDFELIAEITGQQQEWIVNPGSTD